MKLENINAFVFDAYGTLFDVNSAAENCKNKIGSKWEMFSIFWRTTQLEYTWLRTLMRSHRDFWKITEDSLDHSMKVFNIESGLRNELLDLYKKLKPYKEVKKTLEILKSKNKKLAILSNGTPDLLNDLVRINNLDNVFDDLFSIEEIKIYKPDPRVYEIPLKKYNYKPENICFFSSNTWDVAGAGIFGYQSIWVNRFNKNYDKFNYKPSFIFKSLNDILELI